MRILIFHGYLLRGTGSNVYNAELAAALARLGHEVHMVCQDREVARTGLGNPNIHLHVPDIGRILPVYVQDTYEGFEAKTFINCTDAEVAHYINANVTAVRQIAQDVRPGVALANHVVMGPVILARALGRDVPYAVKVHGSDLEYVVKVDYERFGPFAREGLAQANGILVGSRHTAESLWATMEDPELRARTRLGPPGVDVETFAARERWEAVAGLRGLAERLQAMAHREEAGSFARDERAAGEALASLDVEHRRLVTFVGKLILAKGVDLLAAAWPLVVERVPDAHLVVVGFGAFHEGFRALLDALARGDLEAVRALADTGRAAEGGPAGRLKMLSAFLDTAGEDYAELARRAADTVTLVGRLDHAELADLLPVAEAQVVPSTFPEAFGMVAAEAAACGVLPITAAHSGLAEVSARLAEAVPAEARGLLAFSRGPEAVRDLAARITGWLEAEEDLRARTRAALVQTAREEWSWEGVARGVIAAAEGRLDDLSPPS